MESIKTNKMKDILSKVPEVTVYFWVIKVLCTTVGETFSDFLNVNLGLGLTGTSIIMGVLFAIVLFFQFRAKKYIPGLYWLTVVLISVFGTLVTDNLTDKMGVPLEVSTIVFSIALALTFAIWFGVERTLSIHSIFTRRREAFYWLAILFTFALGTASGDLMAESLGLGYLTTGIIVCAVIISVSVSWKLGLDSVLAFWIVYIMTRPLGASIGDYLTQSHANGGLGLGATVTSVIFLLAILLTVLFLTITRRDLLSKPSTNSLRETKGHSVVGQVAVVIIVLVLAAGIGYYWRHTGLQNKVNNSVSATSPLGDLSTYKKITNDVLGFVKAKKLANAQTRVGDLEFAWDNAEARLKPMSPANWSKVDKSIDNVLRRLRAAHQNAVSCQSSLESLISVLNTLDNRMKN